MEVMTIPPEVNENFGCLESSKQAISIPEIRVQAKPINLILEEKNTSRKPPLRPRHYQEELCRQALEGNKIIYLGTGLGKTFIIVMMLKDPSISDQINRGRRAIFLAPTQDLVKQQAQYIYSHVPYRVRVYCGRTCNAGLHIDNWNKAAWDNELKNIELMFMTPAILTQALAIGALEWDSISLVIFDEAHHAATTKKERSGKSVGSQYSQILKHYGKVGRNSSKLPKFVGLTASLINDMPTNSECIRIGIRDLENKFPADCITDLTAIESKPIHVIWTYCQSDLSRYSDPIISLFEEYAERLEAVLQAEKIKKMMILGPQNEDDKKILAYSNRLRLAASGFSIKPKSLHKVFKQLVKIRSTSGLWTLAFICCKLSEAMHKQSKLKILSANIKPVFSEFGQILTKVLLAIQDITGSSHQAILLDYSQPKLMCLLDILSDEFNKIAQKSGQKETFSCIVFVKSRVEVLAIYNWLRCVSEKIEGYNFIKVQYAIGISATMASKWACITRRKATEQSAVLEDFRKGKLNVIVTTSVLEEGIDLPVCSTVIRFDKADTFRVYVQSRGRARQTDSTYVDMCDRKARVDYEGALDKFADFEKRVREVLQKKDVANRPFSGESRGYHGPGGDQDESHQDYFEIPAKKIFISAPVARTILHMYCARLTRNCPYSDGLQFTRRKVGELIQTTLFFPAGCPVKDNIVGKPKKTVHLADSSAVIAAYAALYESGELDDSGVPVRATEEHIDDLLDKFNLKPDFSPLADCLEGEIFKKADRSFHTYPWKIFNLTSSSLARDFTTKNYKLLQIRFRVANEGSARSDCRRYFERTSFGLILDSKQEHANLPSKIFSHYGEFLVDYHLLDANLTLNVHAEHHTFSNYTFRLLMTFWNLPRIDKLSFSERCMFYLVPIDRLGKIDVDRIRNAFYSNHCNPRPGEVVRVNQLHRTPENAGKRFVVVDVRHDLSCSSQVPGCRETFADRLESQGMRVQDARQPVIAVQPIARDFARTSPGKRVRADDTTQLNYYLRQCLECINCDADEAFQAYNLPEIIYQIYINELGADLERQYSGSTAVDRDMHIANQNKPDDNVDKVSNGEVAELVDDNESRMVAEDAEAIPDDAEFFDSEMNHSDSDADSDDDPESSDSDSDAPQPTIRYLDIFARQEFNYQDRDNAGLERWDMKEYNVPDIERQSKVMKTSSHTALSPISNSMSSLRMNTIAHLVKIEEILRKFQQGIMGDSEFQDDNDLFDRRGCTVDTQIKPPISFDQTTKPNGLPLRIAFIEAITSRRASDIMNLEGLENIGDSYLKYCVSVVLFKYLDCNEGILTNARSRLVSNKHFCHLAKKCQLGQYAITNKFDRDVFGAVLGAKQPCKNRLRPKDLADMVESLIGASLVHGGEYEAIMGMRWLGLGHIFRDDTFEVLHANSVVFSRLENPVVGADGSNLTEFIRQNSNNLKKVQSILNYRFNNELLLVQALTHASAFNRHTESYERLEFLGDAILDFLITMTLYRSGLTKDPGQITTSRSALVNNYTFAKLAIRHKLDVFIQHANHQMYEDLVRVAEQAATDAKLEFLSMVDYDRISKTLADVFEAVAGAIYLDSGCSLDAVYSIYYPMMKGLIDEEIEYPTKNVITQLYELFPGKDRIKFEYFKTMSAEEEGKAGAQCTIHGLPEVFVGEGLNNRQAKMRAVLNILERLPTNEEKLKLDEEWDAYDAQRRREQPRASRPQGNRGGPRAGGSRGGHYGGGPHGGHRGDSRGRDNRGGYRGAHRGRMPTFRYKRY